MADQIFDPNNFMPETSEAGSTANPICEPGEYQATIEKVEPKIITAGPSAKNPGRQMPTLEVTWKIENNQFEKDYGYKPTIRQLYWLDMVDGTRLDMGKGKNIQLNKLREALG